METRCDTKTPQWPVQFESTYQQSQKTIKSYKERGDYAKDTKDRMKGSPVDRPRHFRMFRVFPYYSRLSTAQGQKKLNAVRIHSFEVLLRHRKLTRGTRPEINDAPRSGCIFPYPIWCCGISGNNELRQEEDLKNGGQSETFSFTCWVRPMLGADQKSCLGRIWEGLTSAKRKEGAQFGFT